jgi:hypothetical protein
MNKRPEALEDRSGSSAVQHRHLAREAALGVAAIRRVEGACRGRIWRYAENAGFEFIDENGVCPGVR